MTTNNGNMEFDKRKGKNPFTVPENYFNDFESNLMDKIQVKEEKIKVPMVQMVKPYLYIAASFLLFFLGGRFVITNFSNPEEPTLSSNTLTFDQEMELIYSEVDDFTITNYLLENDFNETVNDND